MRKKIDHFGASGPFTHETGLYRSDIAFLLCDYHMYASAKERKNMDKNPPISRVQVLGAFEVIEIQY